jgi:multiple antibiotic resistance protein
MELVSTAILLFIVIDPFGNIPFILSILKDCDDRQYRRTVVRELLISLAVLSAFLFFGNHILSLFQISRESISIAGGVILLIISLKMIFKGSESIFEARPDTGALIVPIAIPSIAGPSAITTCMLVSSKTSLGPLLLAWVGVSVLLVFSKGLGRLLGPRGLSAMDRLMGLLLVAIAVEMMKNGLVAVLCT